jgi:quercetin dioxygenase-like cupin family protein
LLGVWPGLLQAADAPLGETYPLPAVLSNQEMRVVEVQLAPGQASSPHRHNAHVFVYVLEGEVEMQVDGGELRRLLPGDTFYESPDDVHVVSRNPSSTEGARFLVHMLKQAGAPVSVPVD